jgi:hypothetical protein
MDVKIVEQVRDLRAKGLKRKDIAKQIGVSLATVARAIAILKETAPLQSANSTLTEDKLREIIREEISQGKNEDSVGFPMVLKSGKGQEVIAPEGILQHYLLADGDAGAWMFKGMMMLRAAQLMVMSDVEIMKGQADAQAAAIKPILDIMEKAREDMDAAAQRAKESGAAIAEAAAAGAAARATMHIDEKFNELKQQKPDIATVQDPMKGLMARTMETMVNRLQSMLFGGGDQVSPTPGLVDKRALK